jgi:phenylpyruvate tautomerase PptA (4-oxalocrotonate tautomerase family)
MPRLDAYIPAGALTADAESQLLSTLTDLLIRHEGGDPNDPRVRSIAWVFLHRPETVYVAGSPATAPRYRFEAAVPEAVLDAENGAHDRDPMRVWVFTPEIPDGTWGGGGRVMMLADIVGFALGDAEKGRIYAQRILAERRGQPATA